MTSIATHLQAFGAQQDVVPFAEAFADDWQKMFQACPRADWLLALGARFGASRQMLVRAAVGCTRDALAYLPEDNPVLTAALATAEAWSRGEVDAASCAKAEAELAALTTDDAVVDSILQAAIATLAAVHEPQAAAQAAACTANAAVMAAGECAMTAALRFTQERCASITREVLTPTELARLATQATAASAR